MIAVGIDIAWGYGGMLALGQGVFFGLGAYCMGMYLSLEQVESGQLPQFMALYGDQTELPLIWRPFESLWFAGAAALLVPMLVAGLLGWLVFRRRIRGPYFALLTQATALIFWLLLVGQLKVTAGTNGLTNFGTIFGRSKYEPGTNRFLFALAAAGLLAVLLIGRQLVRSRFGRLLVATRDGEDRVRFLGYDPAVVKTVAFVVAAGMAGLAGALAAPIIGIVAPNQFAVLPSILMITWVAIGGRGTLYGAVLGALLVSWGKTSVSESRPDDWLYIQGLLFVLVVAYAPGGLLGLVRSGRALVARRFSRDRASSVAPPALADTVPETFEVAT
jgi:urea transport system permease protein